MYVLLRGSGKKTNKQTKRKTSYLACYQPSSAAASYSFFVPGKNLLKCEIMISLYFLRPTKTCDRLFVRFNSQAVFLPLLFLGKNLQATRLCCSWEWEDLQGILNMLHIHTDLHQVSHTNTCTQVHARADAYTNTDAHPERQRKEKRSWRERTPLLNTLVDIFLRWKREETK